MGIVYSKIEVICRFIALKWTNQDDGIDGGVYMSLRGEQFVMPRQGVARPQQ